MNDEERSAPTRQPGAPAGAAPAGPGNDAAPAGQGTVVLSRVQDGYRDALRRYTVLVDDATVGTIRRGRTLRLALPAGPHRLQLKVDWCASRPLTAVVEPGGTVSFVCSPGGDASEGLGAVGAGRDDYITLQQTPEPVVVTRTSPDRRTRFLLGAAFGFFAGALTLVAALVWHFTGAAPRADEAVAGTGLVVTLGSMTAFRFGRRRDPARRRRN
ncbi:hypothetical protein, partial [Peterkaempfera griseoplana]|uniref:hypothetical protein n=1 Tax=Peterkaempfera griseoplana TaxID=66896 RepID=UPI0006E3C53B